MKFLDVSQNTVIQGDNLLWLPLIPDESIDLCYIDPPFCSNREYILPDNSVAFSDKFKDLDEYIEFLRPRVELIYQKLKNTGAIFVHCDSYANYMIRVLLNDVFGTANMVNEISWERSIPTNDARYKFPVVTDTIFLFKKGEFTFTPQYQQYTAGYIDRKFRYSDDKGRYQLGSIVKAHTMKGNHHYTWKGYSPPIKGWSIPIETMAKWDEEGLLHYPKNVDGTPDYTKRLAKKSYFAGAKGRPVSNLWTDFKNVQGSSKERTGYPTQKPEELLERIIKCSTNEGDAVLDCFAGSFTTAKVAADLNRKFISGDLSPLSVQMGIDRLKSNGIEFKLERKVSYTEKSSLGDPL